VAAIVSVAWAARATAATGADAVVLVSGFTTTTPFTTPSAQCQGSDPRGDTWSLDAARWADAGYKVYTAPVTDGGGTVKPNPPMFSDCPKQLPARMTVNSRGDIYANATALARFVSYLHFRYRVDTVRFVDHSYGGLWTRGAMRLAAKDFRRVHVQSITTLGTPHLGSFLADIGEAVDPSLCGGSLACKIIANLLVAYRNLKFEPAIGQATAAAVAQWNPGQGNSLKGIPVTAIGGNAITIPGISDPYVSPDDAVIGIESTQAVGLESSGVIPDLSCFPAVPDVHSNSLLPFFPGVKYSLIDDPAVASDVERTLAGDPPKTDCPDPPLIGPEGNQPPVTYSPTAGLTVPLEATEEPPTVTPATPGPGNAILVIQGTHVDCDGRQLGSIPFFDLDRIQVIPEPDCRGRLHITPAGAGALYVGPARDSLTLRVENRTIRFRVDGPDQVRRLAVAVKHGDRFVDQRLGPGDSLRFAAGDETETVRVTVTEEAGEAVAAVVTVYR
jgi:triacylglycerol lipase